ncbi:hypothetical protein BCR33DRAFT_725223 [Rhizoclosmatium globosum]|uniref:Uncharacterized protein n=1 Tax=Rhizoclosmatium globosum TaxID=329046 RepID=A0A1Y2AZW3_9FUNG|nr:hypothetical protein BCR33DRAFT_725223 [Rhizoclosmatium globosum]|eukprot:ORY28111.1 hypothetical protein BCR33DRAFT_725223 [Rhizoclosmatium globosum]
MPGVRITSTCYSYICSQTNHAGCYSYTHHNKQPLVVSSPSTIKMARMLELDEAISNEPVTKRRRCVL